MLAATGVTGVAIAAIAVAPALACYPQGKIVKTVTDNTTSSGAENANTVSGALNVNQGDTLTYSVTVSNQETQEGDQHQADMTNTVLTDTLPDGVELVSNPNERVISENLGTIASKGSVTKQYQVKVTETTDGSVLTNKACFTGGSNLGKKYNQSGCDVAIVKVHVPTTPAPKPTPSPTPTSTPPAVLPNTGAGNVIVPAVVLSVLGYAGYLLHLKRRAV
jgi:uncharacterized repeat protein (TIGR01451 family)